MTETTADVDMIKIEMEKLFCKKISSNDQKEIESKKKISEYNEIHKGKIFDYSLPKEILINIIQNLKTEKAVGYSGVSCELFKYGISDKLIELIRIILETMINYDIKPENINIGLIKPVVKDKKKDWNDVNNLRPITISDSLAII